MKFDFNPVAASAYGRSQSKKIKTHPKIRDIANCLKVKNPVLPLRLWELDTK